MFNRSVVLTVILIALGLPLGALLSYFLLFEERDQSFGDQEGDTTYEVSTSYVSQSSSEPRADPSSESNASFNSLELNDAQIEKITEAGLCIGSAETLNEYFSKNQYGFVIDAAKASLEGIVNLEGAEDYLRKVIDGVKSSAGSNPDEEIRLGIAAVIVHCADMYGVVDELAEMADRLNRNSSGNKRTGLELICTGRQARTNHQPVYVDCNNRNDFINTLGRAWQTLRESNIDGTLEDLCWEAYSDARDIHPSISFYNISDSFLMRCNMGLEYVNN